MIVKDPLVFAIESYEYLAADVCAIGGFAPGMVERKRFPDGELYLRIVTPVAGRHVALLGGTISDSATLELYDLACALVKYGAESLTLVMPYFGYSTMERAVKSGEVVTAKTRARLFSAIPEAAFGNRIVMLDLHSSGIPHYFEGGTVPVHVYSRQLVRSAARRLGGDRFVLACTDAGRAKWVESLANDLGVPAAFVFKKRLDGENTMVTAVSAYVQDQDVVIYDDMVRTGSSLINAARAYRDAGARRLTCITTHGVFPGDALARIQATGLLSHIVTTDSHPRARELASDFLSVNSVAGLLAEHVKGVPEVLAF